MPADILCALSQPFYPQPSMATRPSQESPVLVTVHVQYSKHKLPHVFAITTLFRIYINRGTIFHGKTTHKRYNVFVFQTHTSLPTIAVVLPMLWLYERTALVHPVTSSLTKMQLLLLLLLPLDSQRGERSIFALPSSRDQEKLVARKRM